MIGRMHNHPLLMNIAIGLSALAGGAPLAITIGSVFGLLSGSVVIGAIMCAVWLIPCAVYVHRAVDRDTEARTRYYKRR